MGILLDLSSLALQPLLEGACRAVGWDEGAQTLRTIAADDRVTALVGFLQHHFTDHSNRLNGALNRANKQAWKALEIALAGTSWRERCQRWLASGDQKAFSRQVQQFLASVPVEEFPEQTPDFRQRCVRELRAAVKAGALTGESLEPRRLAERAAAFARFTDPQRLLDAQWETLSLLADSVEQAQYPTLAQFLRLRSASGPSLLVVAVRYFFRREIETDQQLFQGLAWGRMDRLQETQENGFAALQQALTEHGDRLEEMLEDLQSVVGKTHDVVLNIHEELQGQREQVRDLGHAVLQLLEQHQLQSRDLRPSDSLSIRGEDERRLVKALVGRYRDLPEPQRRQLPALLNALGKLQVVAGDFDEAQRDFQTVTTLVANPKARAEAHHNAYQAALERRDWPSALHEIEQAAKLDPARFAPFPFEKYEPERILGAGGFGVAFLCRNRNSNALVVVKALRLDDLDRQVTDVFREAETLEQVEHPAIIRLRDCDFAGAERTRPYLVMDYFEGLSLDEHVKRHGRLQPAELLDLACSVAEGLQAAHGKQILHRDVKPANLLIRRESGARLQVKLIDFGLAMRRSAKSSTIRGSAEPNSTVAGKSASGTVDYAAPEQMGKLPGVPVGPHSDIYGFGKTCCYALFQTPQPLRRHWQGVPAVLAEVLEGCLEESPERRPASFSRVLERLSRVREEFEAPLVLPAAQPRAARLPEVLRVPEPPKAIPVLEVPERPRAIPVPLPVAKAAGGPEAPPRAIPMPAPKAIPVPLPPRAVSTMDRPQAAPTREFRPASSARLAPATAVLPRRKNTMLPWLIGGGVAALAVLVLGGFLLIWMLTTKPFTSPENAVVGTWTTTAMDQNGRQVTCTLELRADKSYTASGPGRTVHGWYNYNPSSQELAMKDDITGLVENWHIDSVSDQYLNVTRTGGSNGIPGEKWSFTRTGK